MAEKDTNFGKSKIPILESASGYKVWSKLVVLKLTGLGLRTCIKAESSIRTATQQRKDAKALFVILKALSPKLQEEFVLYETAYTAWNAVKVRMGGDNRARLHKLQLDIDEYVIGDSVVEHVGRLNSMFIEYEHAGGSLSDNMKVTKLLKGLPGSYRNWCLDVRTRQRYRDEEDNFKYAFIYSELRDRAVVAEQLAKAKGKKDKPKKQGKSKNNGDKETSNNDKNKKSQKKKDIKCYACGKPGHSVRKCRDEEAKKEYFIKQKAAKEEKVKTVVTKEDTETTNDEKVLNARVLVSKVDTDTFNDENLLNEKVLVAKGENSSSASERMEVILDSGASIHLSSSADCMHNKSKLEQGFNIEGLGGERKRASIKGDLHCQINEENIIVRDVVYLEEAGSATILSVGKLCDRGFTIVFRKEVACVYDPKMELVLNAYRGSHGLYWIKAKSGHKKVLLARTSSLGSEYQLWHKRLGHASCSVMENMKRSVTGLPKTPFKKEFCEACAKGKLAERSIDRETGIHRLEVTEPFQKVHADLVGPLPKGGTNKFVYFLLLVDDYSRYKWLHCLQKKSQTADVIINWVNKMENLLDRKIKVFRSDGGGEFKNKKLLRFWTEKGIKAEFITRGRSFQNGLVERANRTVQEGIMTLLSGASISKWYWPYAGKTFVYLSNRTGTRVLDYKTPYEVFYGKVPDLKHLRVFGSLGTATTGEHKGKLETRGKPIMFLGYSEDERSYVVLWKEKNAIGTSRTVSLDEMEERSLEDFIDWSKYDLKDSLENLDKLQELVHKEVQRAQGLQSNDSAKVHVTAHANDSVTDFTNDERHSSDIVDLTTNKNKLEISTDGSHTLRQNLLNYVMIHSVPRRFHEIKRIQDKKEQLRWYESYEQEISSLEETGNLEIIERNTVPKGCQILPLSEVFRIKASGKYKTRICARGDLQRSVEDTFAPTLSAESVRILVALAAHFQVDLHQGDVKCAFLHGKLDKEIYLELPDGHSRKEGKRFVYRTSNSIYGLRVSPKKWYERLVNSLTSFGLLQCRTEPCLFTKNNFYLGVYVDDLLFISLDDNETLRFKKHLQEEFTVNYEENVRKFLGFEIKKFSEGSYFLTSQGQIEKMLETFRLEERLKPVNIPLAPGFKLNESIDYLDDPTKYQSLLGGILYIQVCTRPDISYAVNQFSRYAQKPTKTNLHLLKRLLRYLGDTKELGLKYTKNRNGSYMEVEAEVDASWADLEDRRSTYGYVVRLNGNLVRWRTKAQKVVARSTSEAEFMGISEVVKEVLFLKNVMTFFDFEVKNVRIWNDNQGALKMCNNLGAVRRTRHMEIKYFHIVDLVKNGTIEILYKATKELLADMLTKALARPQFEKLRGGLLCHRV